MQTLRVTHVYAQRDLPVLDVSSQFLTAAGWGPCVPAPFEWGPDSCILKVDT